MTRNAKENDYCPVIAAFICSWNDSLPDQDRTRLLTPLLPRLVGTRSTPEIEQRRSYLALDWLVRTYTSAWLDLVEACKADAAALRALAPVLDEAAAKSALSTIRHARDATCDAMYAAWAAEDPWDWDERAAKDATWAAADAAMYAAQAAWAAGEAAWDAGDAARVARAAGAARAVGAAWAARARLRPVVIDLQASALRLIDSMLAEHAA